MINPKDIPDSAVGAWREAFWGHNGDGSMKAAIAAALNDMLGEPVAWMRRNITYFAVDGRTEGERVVSERRVYPDDVPLYAIKQGASRE